MTADDHIEAIRAALADVESAQTEEKRAMKKTRRATALLHARLSAAAVEYRDTHGHNSDVIAAAVLPKDPPDED